MKRQTKAAVLKVTRQHIKSRTHVPTFVICAVHVSMAQSAIFQHHHGGVAEGKAAHYRGCIPFSIPASCCSRSVRSDWRGLVSAAAKWSHQSQSRHDGKSSINQLKMMKSESSRLIKASKREITDPRRVVTTQKIPMRNDFITCKSTDDLRCHWRLWTERMLTKEPESEDNSRGRPPALPHICRQMLQHLQPELANNHPRAPARR